MKFSRELISGLIHGRNHRLQAQTSAEGKGNRYPAFRSIVLKDRLPIDPNGLHAKFIVAKSFQHPRSTLLNDPVHE